MPHTNDTVIEMSPRRSRGASPRRSHESAPIHRVSPNRAHSPSPRNNHGNVHSTDSSARHSSLHPEDYNIAHTRTRRDVSPHSTTDTMQPLLEVVNEKPKPPMAGPEIDDLEGDGDKVATSDNHPGIDDQFNDPTLESRFGEDGEEGAPKPADDPKPKPDDDKYDDDDEVDGLIPVNGEPNGVPRVRPVSPFPPMPPVDPRVTPDVNVYQQKKNLAQGMMDLALLSANANQLRYVLEASGRHPYYLPSLIFISASLILQVAVGVGLIINSRYNVKEHDDICKADRINDFTVIGIFMITCVNVFVASFGVADSYPNYPPNTVPQNIGT